VRYEGPVGYTRDVIEIRRKVWRGERLDFTSRRFTLPLTADQGGGGWANR
jgi:hypothetical protein